MRLTPTTILILVCIICLNFFPVPADADPSDVYWSAEFCPPGISAGGTVYAVAVYEGNLVIGGDFTLAGCESVKNLAVWDGTAWSALGSGLDGIIRALTVHDNLLVAGGYIETGDTTIGFVNSWDGVSWTPVGGTMAGHVYALTVYNNGIIAGGWFSEAGGVAANSVAAWDGSAWVPLAGGLTVTSGYYEAYTIGLTVFDNKLIAAGSFSHAGGTEANCVAAWDGGAWSALGPGFGNLEFPPGVLTVWDNKLVVAAYFLGGQPPGNNIKAWDGSSWSNLGDDLVGFRSLAVHNGELYAGCQRSSALAPDQEENTFVWDGNQWNWTGEALGGYYALISYNGNLTNGLSIWAGGTSWSWLNPGLDERILVMTEFQDKLIVSGYFTQVGDVATRQIAAWDGTDWSAIHNGFYPSDNFWSVVYDMEEFNGELVIGGDFIRINGIYMGSIARWNGNIWNPVGGGVGGDVLALGIYDNRLIVAGDFERVRNPGLEYVYLDNIAAWDGSTWSPLGDGLTRPYSGGEVYDVCAYDYRLFAVGDFTESSAETLANIAVWDGEAWTHPGFDTNPYNPVCLFVHDGMLIVAANNSSDEGAVWAWDGVNLTALGNIAGWNHIVDALTVYDGLLFAGGRFTTAGGVPANRIAVWRNSQWEPLGSGIGQYAVHALGVFDNTLMAGGWFWSAGGKPSNYLARWTLDYPTAAPSTGEHTPSIVRLYQNSPNPFNPVTTIRYTLPGDSHVNLAVYSPSGRLVRTLVDGKQDAGGHDVFWDGTNDAGNPVASGVYVYRLRTGNQIRTKKMTLLK